MTNAIDGRVTLHLRSDIAVIGAMSAGMLNYSIVRWSRGVGVGNWSLQVGVCSLGNGLVLPCRIGRLRGCTGIVRICGAGFQGRRLNSLTWPRRQGAKQQL